MALANLLENAHRHGAPPYQLVFSATDGHYQLRLHNAPGEKRQAQRDSGTGLGLRICQTVAALHRGRFVLEHSASGVTALLEWPQ
jgi:signal transduction histidine kinase